MTLVSSTWLTSGELCEPPADDAVRTLAARAKSGDHVALRSIYERYAPAVRRFVRDLLRDAASAEDALQDTFVRVFQRITTLDAPEQLAGWIFGIARRVCLEHRRGASRRMRHAQAAVQGFEPADSRATPEAVYFGNEAAAALERAVDALSPDRRAVLLLRCDHQLPYEQIATAMGFSVAKVKVELHRARAALAAVLHGGPSR